MQLLRTLLIIIIIYYLAKLFARYVLPLIARYFVKRTMNKFNESQQPKQKKSGEVHVESKPDNKPVSDKMGEYVDYEEINE
jgi:hypothetical protein